MYTADDTQDEPADEKLEMDEAEEEYEKEEEGKYRRYYYLTCNYSTNYILSSTWLPNKNINRISCS